MGSSSWKPSKTRERGTPPNNYGSRWREEAKEARPPFLLPIRSSASRHTEHHGIYIKSLQYLYPFQRWITSPWQRSTQRTRLSESLITAYRPEGHVQTRKLSRFESITSKEDRTVRLSGMGISGSLACLPHPHPLHTPRRKLPCKTTNGTNDGPCHTCCDRAHRESMRVLRNLVAADRRLYSNSNDEEGFWRLFGWIRTRVGWMTASRLFGRTTIRLIG